MGNVLISECRTSIDKTDHKSQIKSANQRQMLIITQPYERYDTLGTVVHLSRHSI